MGSDVGTKFIKNQVLPRPTAGTYRDARPHTLIKGEGMKVGEGRGAEDWGICSITFRGIDALLIIIQ